MIGLFYILAALVCFLFPEHTVSALNLAPKYLHLFQALPVQSEPLWQVYMASLLGVLAAISYLAAESPQVRGYSLAHILAKAIAGAGFLYLFFNQASENRYFAYLFCGVIESLLGLYLIWLTVRGSGGVTVETVTKVETPAPFSEPPPGNPS